MLPVIRKSSSRPEDRCLRDELKAAGCDFPFTLFFEVTIEDG